jgi:hypothetical protein
MAGDVLDTNSERAVFNALADAVKFTGYLPREIRYDRFPGHNTHLWHRIEDELSSRGVTMKITSRPEGKASMERAFGSFQSLYLTDSDFYYGVVNYHSQIYEFEAYLEEMLCETEHIVGEFERVRIFGSLKTK